MPLPVKFKVCGVTTEEIVQISVEAGASYIGFVFYEPSPRNLSLEKGSKLADFSRGLDIPFRIVALMVDESDSRLSQIIDAVRPDILQLHGNESSKRISEIKDRFELPVIKSVGISSPSDLKTVKKYESVADFMVYDAKPEGDSHLPGGNGLTFDWNILPDSGFPMPFMLSGGLNSSNVAEAIRLVRPFVVDVSSGVESQRGVKDPKLIREFAAVVADSPVDDLI